MPQLSRSCSEFDPELLYRLKPGACVFSNEEYRTTISANSLGVRGAEEDLANPEVIVLGDSYSMGWGVEDDETYSSVLARRSGKRVLNLAVPSYGTARQATMLERADRSGLRTLILQYCGNDLNENRQYVEQGFRLEGHGLQEHQKWIRTYERYRSYYPGKLTVYSIWTIWDRVKSLIRPSGARPETPGEDARLVRRILDQSADLIGGARVVVFAISGPSRDLARFGADLRRELDDSEAGLRVDIVELERELSADHFFDLDPHLTPDGHRVVATLLEPYLSRGGVAISERE